MSLRKEVLAIVREARRQGWAVEQKKNGWAMYPPGSDAYVMLHKTPSDPRGLKNSVARMRRYGFRWKGH